MEPFEQQPSKVMDNRLLLALSGPQIASAAHPQLPEPQAVVPFIKLESQAIMNALVQTGGDTTLTARLLGIGRTTVYRRVEQYQLGEHLRPAPQLPEPQAVVLLTELESQAIANALAHTGGNAALTARLLGIGRTTVYRRVKQYQLGEHLRYSRHARVKQYQLRALTLQPPCGVIALAAHAALHRRTADP